MALNAHETRPVQANRFEVINGQQRITTLYLLLAALRDVGPHAGTGAHLWPDFPVTYLTQDYSISNPMIVWDVPSTCKP